MNQRRCKRFERFADRFQIEEEFLDEKSNGCDKVTQTCPPVNQAYSRHVLTFNTRVGKFEKVSCRGFQVERSEIRSAMALSRLCFILAVATLLLTVQGQQVVATGKRRWVDCHWQRGNSYLRIGWNWVKGTLHRGWRSRSHLRFARDLPTLILPSPRTNRLKNSWSGSSP